MADLDVRSAVRAAPAAVPDAAARAQLRAQVAALDRRLAETVAAALADGAAPPATMRATRTPPSGAPRLLDLGDLERVRDDLAARLSTARAAARGGAVARERARVRLERMLLDPGAHRFERVAQAELGNGGCGVWQVRPRLGPLGMLMGWWRVTLSSGCPRAAGR